MKSILLLVALIHFAEVADSCCCSIHWGKWNCFCNFFNCNCKTVYPGYCQYTPGMSVFDDCQTDTTGKSPYEICGHWQNETNVERQAMKVKVNHPMHIFKSLDHNQDGYIAREEFKKSSKLVWQFMNPTQAKAAMLRRADMDHIFDSLDVNKQGKLAPRDIDESLEGRIWPEKNHAYPLAVKNRNIRRMEMKKNL